MFSALTKTHGRGHPHAEEHAFGSFAVFLTAVLSSSPEFPLIIYLTHSTFDLPKHFFHSHFVLLEFLHSLNERVDILGFSLLSEHDSR